MTASLAGARFAHADDEVRLGVNSAPLSAKHGLDPLDLAEIIEAAPFGLTISASDGKQLYSNAFATEALEDAGARFRNLSVRVGSRDFLINLATDDSDEKERQKQLFRMAYFDKLTGLPNGVVMEQSVASLIEDGAQRFAIATIDLDGFHDVNETLGRAAGDELLVKVADRISGQLRDVDLLARLYGNLFVLLLADGGDVDVAERLASISERIKQPFVVEAQEVLTSATIGVSVFPDDGRTYGALTWNAERSMSAARQEMMGCTRFYDRSMDVDVADKKRAEQRLRLAIRDRRLVCAYQPKFDIHSREISGVEVLMRWRDEDGNIQSPAELLPVATKLGLIDDIAFMVLEETVRSIDRIGGAFGRDCTVSINIAAMQAGDERFMREFVGQLEATGFAQRLIIEVSEEAFLAKDTFQKRILPMIREIGARVSIDDFGTGYSSLSALAGITADELKIDRAFITDVHLRPRSQNVLKAIEALGHSLGMQIVVEGVETIDELNYLRTHTQIPLAQGHYFARPMLLDDIDSTRPDGVRASAVTRPVLAARI